MPDKVNHQEPQPAVGAATLHKGLGLLFEVAQSEEAITLSQLARSTGLNKATALRLLRTLESWSLVRRVEGGGYRLGGAVMQLGQLFGTTSHLQELIVPAMREIVSQTGESCSFFVTHGNKRLCVAVQNGTRVVSANTKPGDLYSLDVGSSSKVLQSYAEGRPKSGPIKAILSLGERDPELAGLSAPVFDASGRLLGALAVAGTVQRFSSRDHVDILEKALLRACEAISTATAGDERLSQVIGRRSVA